MKYYPICLDIKDKQCLVVGGGLVGTRKVQTLLDCGAHVRVVSLRFSDELQKLAQIPDTDSKLTLIRRTYKSCDLTDIFFVFF